MEEALTISKAATLNTKVSFRTDKFMDLEDYPIRRPLITLQSYMKATLEMPKNTV